MSDNEFEETLTDATKSIAEKLGIILEPYDFCSIHRLPSRDKNHPPSVIVKLNSRTKKRQLVEKSKTIRLEGIFVTNHLTRKTQVLKAKAIKFCNSGHLKYVWDTDKGNATGGKIEIVGTARRPCTVVSSIGAKRETKLRKKLILKRI
jgi:hypothetical protein